MLVFSSLRFRALWSLVFVLGSVAIAVSLLAYFRDDRTPTFLIEKGDLRHQPLWRTAFYLHITSATVCLLTGPMLMVRRLIRFRKLHRWLGYAHLNSILWVAAPTGLILSPVSKGGPYAAVGFAITGVLWWITTWLGYRATVNRDLADHARWMIRSYSLSLGAVWFRLIQLAIAYGIPAVTARENYIASVWLSLLASVWVAESGLRVAFPVRPVPSSSQLEVLT
ncbi:DUF2306 domain-containing protein [Rhodopirellula sp. MGV]|uniref:DUF2306 domain-containing protein n=1 Tax=Rhodopirellula sp. MGV TaxID=2023130 RepID=UPI000B975339|nr:DUF2306 domain-containing protein [Rhodopirellula sp. MGV]OYP34975.1 hypothetical protein CGZ80_13230 [Rhodopirellula sp. MGV]PNY38129.1 DUF2306 domain-containing protein [Rhodopirellula baltica]